MNTDSTAREIPSILIEGELTDKILAAAFKVHNTLGCGFLEKVYESAMQVELVKLGFLAERQKPLKVTYEGVVVGDYQADLIVNGRVVVECKAITHLEPIHEAQLLNYLRATRIKVGLLLNFGRPKVEFKRLVA